jgi:hypothetical protein
MDKAMKAQNIKENMKAITKEIKAICEKPNRNSMDDLRKEILLTQRLQLYNALTDLGDL